jgi:serine/threonine-protein kinase
MAEERANEAPANFLSEPIQAYLEPLIADLASYEARARIPTTLAAALGARYEVQRELGHGGMAVVYLAFDKERKESVAVKVLSAPLAGGLSVERFTQEIEITSALGHDHIVPVLGRGAAADGLMYYVMRHVGGGSLRERIEREGPLSIDATIAVARDVASALDFAHANGIVHRDIKPENILLDGDRAFVADFGVARLIDAAGRDRLTQTGAVLGTAQYMSPEQAGSEKTIDSRSDIYSLGCVVYEMLAGDPPFTSSSPKVILARQMHERPPRLSIVRPTVTPEVEQAVERALAKQRSDRFQTASAFVDELARSASGMTARSRRIRRRVAMVGAAALVTATSAWLVRTMPDDAGDSSLTDASRRIAVLYFDDLSPDQRLSHIAAGLTEDLIDELSRVSSLQVVSPNGVRMLRDSALAPNALASRLDVGTLIGGSIASSNSLVRVTVRLIDAGDGMQLNSRTLERPAWDILTLQDSITTEVAMWLRERLGAGIRTREQRLGTRSVDAWEMVQRGEALLYKGYELIRNADPLAHAILGRADSAFTSAEQRDRGWGAPTVGRARAALALAFAGRDTRLSSEGIDTAFVEGLRRAIGHADRALERLPNLPEALVIRGEARVRLGMLGRAGDRARTLNLAEADLRQAASARPDFAHAWSILGDVYYSRAQFAEAAEAYTTAYDKDAFLTEVRAVVSSLFRANLYAEDLDKARTWCATGQRRFPGDPRFTECELRLLGATGARRGDAAEAWRIVEEIERADTVGMLASSWSFRRMMVAAVLARAGMRDSALAVLYRAGAERGSRPGADAAEAWVRVILGDRDGALRLLRAIVAAEPEERRWISRVPWYRRLHDDPDFRSLVQEPSRSEAPSGR